MGISDLIAGFIRESLEDKGGRAELQRSELAQRFNCVPSQINYVISTRFSPEHGYIVESRRGGGGYIRITQVRVSPAQLLMHTVNAIGDELDFRTAEALLANAVAGGALEAGAAAVMRAGVTERALSAAPPDIRGALRAAILKQMLVSSN